MNKKYLLLAFVLLLLLNAKGSNAWDTTAAKFYPLSVGNTYLYDHISLWFNCDPFQLIQRHRVVVNDYVMKPNGKYYYEFTGFWYEASHWKYQRIDSSSMNVYLYDTVHNSELMIDSLLANINDYYRCNRFNQNNILGQCHGIGPLNIFGQIRIMKGLHSQMIGPITAGYSLIEGIGCGGYSSCEVGSGSSYSLKGGVIRGAVFGDTTLTGTIQVNDKIPEDFSLSQNYPNPFNPNTIINYSIPSISNRELTIVKLIIYDVLGKELITLVNEKKSPGNYFVTFDGSNLPSGIYFYTLTAGDFSETKKMILLK